MGNETPNRQNEIPSEHKLCDTCKFGESEIDGTVTCFGAPPTPCVVGMQPGPGGRNAFAVELLRPKLRKGTRACRLYETKITLIKSSP